MLGQRFVHESGVLGWTGQCNDRTARKPSTCSPTTKQSEWHSLPRLQVRDSVAWRNMQTQSLSASDVAKHEDERF